MEELTEEFRQTLIDLIIKTEERDDKLKLLSIFLTTGFDLNEIKPIITWLKTNSHI